MNEVAMSDEQFTEADIEAIKKMALERAALMKQLKAALVAGDTLAALRFARLACGLPAEEVAH